MNISQAFNVNEGIVLFGYAMTIMYSVSFVQLKSELSKYFGLCRAFIEPSFTLKLLIIIIY